MQGGKTLVVGAGKSGLAALTLLAEHDGRPVLFDSNEKLNIEEIRGSLQGKAASADIYKGDLPESVRSEITELVISPGVPIDSPFVKSFAEAGVRVNGEIELAFSFEKGTLLAITGTNGKTTTTALCGKILSDYTGKALVVGNIGTPYTGEVEKSTVDSVTVAEISSFQLETADRFRPHIAAILNITPDHLNRHHTMEQYILEKEKIAANQGQEDYLILNYEDPVLREFGLKKEGQIKVIFFSSARELAEGFYFQDGYIWRGEKGIDQTDESVRLIHQSELQILGLHNMENAMAAMAMAYAYGVPMESILRSLREFRAVEHRIEFVREVSGVRYYDDSKGTNVDAAIKGIQAMDRRTCLIGGGYDKGASFDEWIEAFDGKVKKLVLIGQTAEKIADCAKKHGFQDYVMADSLQEAVAICHDNAADGEAVLLSPACASWGMFDNYEQRGDLFKQFVNEL